MPYRRNFASPTVLTVSAPHGAGAYDIRRWELSWVASSTASKVQMQCDTSAGNFRPRNAVQESDANGKVLNIEPW